MTTTTYKKFIPKEVPNFPVAINWSERYCYLPDRFDNFFPKYENLDIRDDDVWIVTMPKCGTTWMQEMAWLIVNDLDFETAKEKELAQRTPFYELEAISGFKPEHAKPLDDLPSRRIIKSHLPMPFLPKQLWTSKAKIIYVARNPKDTAVSFYHFGKVVGGIAPDTTMEKYIEDFIEHRIAYSSYWDHLLEFWELRNDPRVYFTSYERMKKDMRPVIEDLCKFLDKPIPNEQMEVLIDHLSFDKMKDNPACNQQNLMKGRTLPESSEGKDSEFRFMRRGIVGAYKDELPTDLAELIDKRSQEYWTKHGTTEDDIFGPNLV